MKIDRITKGLCSAYLVRDNGSGVLIDTLYPGDEKFIIKKMKELGIYSFELKAIFITHAHVDHAGSAKALSEFFGVPVIAHSLARRYLERGENSIIKPGRFLGSLFLLFFKPEKMSYPSLSPDIIFDDMLDMRDFGIEGYILHTPGHTPGSSSLVLESHDVIIGDLLMGIPFPDLPSYPLFVSDAILLKKSLKKVLDTKSERFYPAHGFPWELKGVSRLYKKLVNKKVREMAFVN